MKIKATFYSFLFYLVPLGISAQDSLYLYTVFHGENDQDQFGVVANVGDVNGDGFEDLMVGAPAYITGTESDGYAKLYLGGASFDTLANLTYRIYDDDIISFGSTITGNGDLNGDGYSDFAIADPHYGDFNIGKVYVYFGGTELDTIPDLELTLEPFQSLYTNFGFSMTMNGDINHDGYDDLVVGAPFDDWDRHGKVFIYFGSLNMDNDVDINLVGRVPYLRFGYSLDYNDDTNEDNINDLLVGTSPFNETVNDERAYIFFGNHDNDIGLHNSYIFVDSSGFSDLARDVSSIGDINDDNFEDFALLSSDSITVCLSPLSNGEFTKYYFRKTSTLGSFYRITGSPDLNKDGFDEIIISSDRTKTMPGKVITIYGDEEVSLQRINIIESEDLKFGFGYQVTTFCSLLTADVVSIAIGHVETFDYEDHGTGKVLIFNNTEVVGIEDDNLHLNRNFTLYQNYPNPFNPITTISYQIPAQSNVKLQLYDVQGREISTFVSEIKPAGLYTTELNTASYSLSSGIYYVKMTATPVHNRREIFHKSIKMILLK